MTWSRKLLARVAALLVSAALGTVVVQAPAAAHDAGDYFCPSGAVCLWYHQHYDGGRYDFYGINYTFYNKWAIDDNDSSWRNNGTSGLRARIWEHHAYGGNLNLCLPMGTRYAHDPGTYGNSSNPVNDEATSNDWASSCV